MLKKSALWSMFIVQTDVETIEDHQHQITLLILYGQTHNYHWPCLADQLEDAKEECKQK